MEVPTPLIASVSALSSSKTTLPTLTAQPAPGEAGKINVSMRGRKKHKCSVCGNIARSRCPFHSCKGCCVKAKNPCYVHVFKPSPSGDNPQGSSAAASIHPPVPAPVVRHPYDSLRLKTVKPMGHVTRKEAAFINAWRFQKLGDYADEHNAAEDEAFDRYMQNVSLLEEVFAVKAESLEGLSPEGHFLLEGSSGSEPIEGGVDASMLSAGLRVRLRISSKRKEAHRQKLRRVIDRSLQKLHRGEREDATLESEDIYMGFSDPRREMKRKKVQSIEGKERLRRMDLFTSLFEKVRHIENQGDLDSCLKIYEDNFLRREIYASPCGWKEAGYKNSLRQSQMTALDYQKVSEGGNRESSKEVISESGEAGASALIFDTSHKARVDSGGVLKGWWKIDASQEDLDLCKEAMGIPVSRLAAL